MVIILEKGDGKQFKYWTRVLIPLQKVWIQLWVNCRGQTGFFNLGMAIGLGEGKLILEL